MDTPTMMETVIRTRTIKTTRTQISSLVVRSQAWLCRTRMHQTRGTRSTTSSSGRDSRLDLDMKFVSKC